MKFIFKKVQPADVIKHCRLKSDGPNQ